MEKKDLLLLLMLTATAINAIGQSAFLGLPSGSYIDNVADSEAVKLGLLAEPLGATAGENRFWTTRKITGTYSFTHSDSKPHGLDERDYHAFVPELYLESANGFSVNIGGVYGHLSSRREFPGFGGNFHSNIEADTYGVSVHPAYDALSLWKQENRPDFMKHSKLIGGLGFAYAHSNAEVNDNFFPGSPTTKFENEEFFLHPDLVFVQPLSEKFITFLIPAYGMDWSYARIKGNSKTTYSDSGLFMLTARGDYKVADRFFPSVFATWKRDLTRRPASPTSDWAEFGAQLRFAISERVALRAGYNYTAFNKDFESHHCFARLETNF